MGVEFADDRLKRVEFAAGVRKFRQRFAEPGFQGKMARFVFVPPISPARMFMVKSIPNRFLQMSITSNKVEVTLAAPGERLKPGKSELVPAILRSANHKSAISGGKLEIHLTFSIHHDLIDRASKARCIHAPGK